MTDDTRATATTATTDSVLAERVGAVGLLRLNRPDRLNAIDLPMLQAMDAAFGQLEADPSVRVIIITGTGERVFMAGGDIAEMAKQTPTSWYDNLGGTVHRLFRRIETCEKPTIAAINGWALGGGMELMLCTDVRLMSADSRIGLPEIKLGIFPGGGGSQRLMRQIPLCQAKLLMFTGDTLDATKAQALGLINDVVPPADLQTAAMALANRIANMSTHTLKLLKQSMLNGADMPLGAALTYELSMLSVAFDHPDAQEGCAAYIEKRKPRFNTDANLAPTEPNNAD